MYYFFSSEFYRKPSSASSKLLIVQCESGNENAELLDAARFIIQREGESPDTDSSVITHTILLLTLRRGCAFRGYQGIYFKYTIIY